MSFSNSRVWFVTGSSQGMGRALVNKILEKKERVVATLRNPSVLGDLQAKFSSEQLLVVRLDVSKPEEITAAFDKAVAHFHRLDVVVNNAGYGIGGEIEGTTDDVARVMFEVLLWGPLNIAKKAVQVFREVNPRGQGGRIVNISSMAGYASHPGIGLYSSAKFALEGFTDALNREMCPEWNIKCIIIEPGGVETNSIINMIRLPMHPAYSAESPSQAFLELANNAPLIGDPIKAVNVIFDISGEADPPLRLPLGSIAYKKIVGQAKKTIEEAEKWKHFSRAVNKDGFEPEVVENMVAL